MATTNKGIYYPNDYSQVADVPEDLKKLAESVDKAIDDIPQYDDSDIKKDIQTIQQEQKTQNTSIQNNTEELELLKNNLPDPVTTEELEEITVQDAMNYYGSLDVSGNSTQATRSGKNKLYLVDVAETTNAHGITYSVEDGVITLNGTSVRAHYINFRDSVFSLPANTYTMSTKVVSGSYSKVSSGKQLNEISTEEGVGDTNIFSGGYIQDTYTHEIEEDKTGVYLSLYIGGTDVFNNYKFEVQLEEGTQATEIEKYGAMPSPDYPSKIKNCKTSINIKVENEDEEKIITFPLKEGQLLHAGDYLASDGVHHVKQTCVFDGTENVLSGYLDETIDSFRIVISGKYNQMLSYQIDDKCSHFKNLGHTPAWGRQANTFALSSEGYLYIFFEKNKITSETEAKNWIAEQYNNGTPLTAEGTLEEEHIEPYTEEQQAAHNELQKLLLYKGYNYIACIDETKCKMQLTYRPDNNIKIKSLEERVAALENSEVTA